MMEYKIEQGNVNIKQLEADFMDEEYYKNAHKGLIIVCHDVFIQYQEGILLVERLNFPAKETLWPIGGRVKRGVSIEDSLREKVWSEV